ncbi:S-layer homology domain-containing protein [Gracilibacillus oryzae]|nr:S-layer homology domain-containing protein [Gracilibacillus oryzae]
MLSKILGYDASSATSAGFTDVDADAWYADYVNVLANDGVIAGYDDNTFKPEGTLTRAEFATLVVQAYGIELEEADHTFTDVPADEWYTPYIETLYANNLIAGKSATRFAPEDNIERADFAMLLANADYAYGDTLEKPLANGVERIVAVNNTTVEVDFAEDVDNVDAIDFAIEGLEVTNAVIKQTDDSVVVLTTSAQEGGEEYTVTANDEELGTFEGVSAVIPEDIEITTKSVQGTVGEQVTLSAQVEVEDDESAAGIPVTFNIVSDDADVNDKIEVEVFTNDEGVAEYSYTRYYKENDRVVAYATDRSSVNDDAIVYWAEGISIEEVTEADTLANGAKKVYKVNTDSTKVAYDASGDKLYEYVNVAFKENVDVDPDELVRSVTVIDTGLAGYDGEYPSQVTTGGKNEVRVPVDEDGEATFTLTGSNATVTPIVFVDNDSDGKLDAKELQAEGSAVEFELDHTLGLSVEAEGVQRSAALTTKGDGGRNYVVTVTDEETGKVAPEDSAVEVVFPEDSFSEDDTVWIEYKNAAGNTVRDEVSEDTPYTIYVEGSDGEAEFRLLGEKNGFATPTVYLDNGDENNKLDSEDLQTVAEKTYFVDAVVNQAVLETYSSDDLGDETDRISTGETAVFLYKSVDQNGFDYYEEDGDYEVSYQVSPKFADVTVSGNGLASTTINKGTTRTVKVEAVNGVAQLLVDSADTAIESNVTVSASSSQVTLEDKPATVTFAKYSTTEVTGTATDVDTAADELTVDGVLYSYDGAAYKLNGSTITKSAFEGYISGDTATVSITKDEDGKLTFDVLGTGTEDVDAVNNAITAGQYKSALAGYENFSSLSTEAQNHIASEFALDTTTVYDADTLAASYETALVNALETLIDAAAGESTYAAFVDAVEDVPGATEAVEALNDVTDADVKTEFEALISGLTFASLSSTDSADISAEYVADVKAAISSATANANATDRANALSDITAALTGLNADPATATYADVITELEDNDTVLGLNLTDFNNLVQEDKEAVIDVLSSTGYSSAAVLQQDLDNAVSAATDLDPASITSAEFDAENNELTLVFDEDIDVTATVATASIDFINGTVTGTTTSNSVSVNGNELVISLTSAVADAFGVDSTIEAITFEDSSSANVDVIDNALTPNETDLTDLDVTVVAE